MVASVHNVRRSSNLQTNHLVRQKPTRRRGNSSPLSIFVVPLPGVRNRSLRLAVPNVLELYSTSVQNETVGLSSNRRVWFFNGVRKHRRNSVYTILWTENKTLQVASSAG